MNYILSLKIIAVAIALYLLYYFIYKFDIDIFMRDILKNYKVKEHFSLVFKPNKLYRMNDKIFLLDTNNIKVKGKNPLIFNSFNEYKDYIISLEGDIHLNNIGNIKDIKNKEEIKEYHYTNEAKNKYNSPDFRNFDYANKCKEKVAFCNSEDIPFQEDILDKDKSETCKEEICNVNLFSDKQCEKIKKFNDKELFIKAMCEENTPKPTEIEKECKYFKKYTRLGNRKLYDEFCIKDKNLSMDKCLLGEYFKDNLLEFEL